jgi:hypothetical protein
MTYTAVCLSIALALAAGAVPGPAIPAAPQQRIVWTNDELAGTALHSAAVSQIGHPASFEFAPAPRPPYQKELDPEWYRERLAPLETERDGINARIVAIRAALANPLAYQEPGLRLDRSHLRLSPQNELALLEARRAELELQIRRILDEARRNWILPGLLR